MTNPSETVLQNALLANMKRAETVLQADFSREIGLIEKNGALRFLQQLLRRKQESPGFPQRRLLYGRNSARCLQTTR